MCIPFLKHWVTGLMVIMTVVALVPHLAYAQPVLTGSERGSSAASRSPVIQLGMGFTVPTLHLGAADEPDDGYAKPSGTLIFRSYIPLKGNIDLMVDLVLPRFKVNEGRFTENTGYDIQKSFYKGKMLSLGARWIISTTPSRRGFVMVSGGMYQLIFDRFIEGMRSEDSVDATVIKGAFKPGFAFGGGMEFKLGEVAVDGVLRYHYYLDQGNFGEGALAWLELGVQISFNLTG